MSKEDIEKAVADAEKFAEEDKTKREEVDIRNGAEQMIYGCEKILEENKDKDTFEKADVDELNEKIDALKEALKGEDINIIKDRQEELQNKFYKLSETLYKKQAAENAQPGEAQGTETENNGDDKGQDYYNADFKDVD